MAILVTGGAGFVGSNAAACLIDAGERVVVLDNFVKGHRSAVHPQAALVEGNILDETVLKRIFAEYPIEAVMHFAAYIEVGESTENPLKYFHNNIAGAHTVLKQMIEAGVTRFIFSSTAAVYGNPDAVPITEDARTEPINPYGLTKRMVEEMLEWYDQAMGLRFVAPRYFNACGASEAYGEDHSPETHLIPNILMAAAGERAAIKVFGTDYPTRDGSCERDYVHVADIAAAHVLALRYLREGGESQFVNLGSASGYTVLEVIDAVKRITGRDFPVVHEARRDGDPAQLVAASDRARRTLGWRPVRSDIDTIVADAWAWKMAHPAGYGD